ncbi:S-layer homology domain-containing protein [Solibacillus cecembensis]|uniref:S-layer homology domain-containing protein n=1 Tax=Solibacillus cecembensis TaxID=459347 RepID=UPI003D06A7B4
MTKSNKSRKFIATSATAALVASAIVPVASAAQINDFNSISQFAQEAVQDLNDRGVIKGDQKGNFNPKNNVTRAEAATILTNALGLEGSGSTSFNDVNKSAWFYNAIDAAVSNGIFQGQGAGKFNPSGNLTRSEAAIILVDAFGLEGSADLSQFKDSASVKSWAQEALEIAVANEVMKGDGGNLKPNASISRQEFAVMYFRTEALETTEETVSGSVKAINNTTVEVTFEDAVADVKALDFAIEGLTVSNAVVKQSDKKTVVLTTSAQTADVTYTVTVDGEAVGTFKGVSAVVPTKVELVSSSVQGKLGQQVSVQAKVTVAEGASKAGIPVTFSIPGNTNDAVKSTEVGEAITNAEGIATYTYTRYGVTTDTVTTYATGDRSKFAIGYVFWGVDTILAITEVTTGATVNNGANKTYKVTYKDPETGKAVANKTFNVGFLENMNVTSDKLANATVNGVKAAQLNNNTKPQAATITTDSKGEATFTVSGVNTAVTPVVFAENPVRDEEKTYKASALQATTAKVTFGAVQADYKIELTREGGEVAAMGAKNGREYKVIVKDKDGKVAKNEIVNVALNENLDRVISTNTQAKFVNADDEVYYPQTAKDGMTEDQISVKTNDKGEATFVISSDLKNDYATPVAWIDINTSDAKQGKLDEGEPKTVAPISYFQEAYLDGASVKSYDKDGKKLAKFEDAAVATFKAELVNQSDKVITSEIKSVSYTVFNTGSNDIEVATKSGVKTVSPNRSITLSFTGELDLPELKVNSVDGKTSSVRVVATGVAKNPADAKDFAFTAKEATATFTASTEVANGYIGQVVSVDTKAKTLTFKGKKAISLKDAKFVTENNTNIPDLDGFITELQKYDTGVEVQYSKDSEGNVTFKIVRALRNGLATDKVLVDSYITALTGATITTTGNVTTPATATIDTALVVTGSVYGNTVKVDGVTFTYHGGATASEALVFKDAADLAYKINAHQNVKVTAVVNGTTLELSDTKNTTFKYSVNGVETTSTTGVAGIDQQVTFTFTSAFNVATGDKVVVNTTNGTVASISSDKKSVVVKFAGTGISATTPVTTFTVTDKTGNTITVNAGVTIK